jgi:hypothetical protein
MGTIIHDNPPKWPWRTALRWNPSAALADW